MATTATVMASLISSDGAHALRSLVEDLARRWTSDKHTCGESSVIFDTIRDIVASAISNVAREWNDSHDVLRAFPPEIQEQCFRSLPVPDRCRLSVICSHWSRNIANLPGIWTALDLGTWKPELDPLLARSGQLLLDISVVAQFNVMSWDSALRPHAARLRKLEVHELGEDLVVALNFCAPYLEELSIMTGPFTTPSISDMLFDQHAPRLRNLHLDGMFIPLECRAFQSVTTATLQRTCGPLDHLFGLMPRLELLNVDSHDLTTSLPRLPRHSALRMLNLVNVFVAVEQLVLLGYSELDAFSVMTETSNMSQFVDAIVRWPALATTARVCANWDFEVVLRPGDGARQLRFAVRPQHHRTFATLCYEPSGALRDIQRLVLPASFRARPYFPLYPMFAHETDVIILPALRTLVIECNNVRPSEDTCPLRTCVEGVLKLPRLMRIEILRAADAACDAPIELVGVGDLLALVETNFVCDDRGALEVFVDTSSGISLVGDVDPLRNCVGRLVIETGP